ncbi:hypothetical protein FHL15_003458 [Xylaria flabelliformis]|uniref:Methyltransferase domain-containing protein n=1 Tax=Xylaria flabelliformis TaxID=2512241 RepID=A0A553I5M1_9PEZI|nr:hypothetical protein FHL15_003458 [Xylaria flabelliformis]
MAPWIPRLHLFEIADQSWFPPFLRAYVQAGLTHAWTTRVPLLQPCSPATLVANILRRQLGASVSSYTYIDFCAGAGGPTPYIEQALNQQLDATRHSSSPASSDDKPSSTTSASSYAAVAAQIPAQSRGHTASVWDSNRNEPVKFILTDLHPHVKSWEKAASESPHLTYVSTPVDAAAAPPDLITQNKTGGKGVFRLFNLAFHHFDDDLARAILKNTVSTSDGFGIFELQSRTFSSFVSCMLFGLFICLIAPLLYWWSPQILFFVYVVPIVPFVLVFDGVISSVRTRTADEVEILLPKGCHKTRLA